MPRDYDTGPADARVAQLRAKLWTKKAKKLKNARVVRADIQVQEAHGNIISLKACSGIQEIL